MVAVDMARHKANKEYIVSCVPPILSCTSGNKLRRNEDNIANRANIHNVRETYLLQVKQKKPDYRSG